MITTGTPNLQQLGFLCPLPATKGLHDQDWGQAPFRDTTCKGQRKTDTRHLTILGLVKNDGPLEPGL